MHIYNIKVNGNMLFRWIFIIIITIAILILSFSIFNIYKKSNFKVEDSISTNNISNLSSKQYTNVLKQVYDNIDTYIGQKINFTGYVYRVYGMNDNEFVLARDMLINSDSQSVVVGFLCNYDKAKEFKDGTWINISGNIIKGYYHNQIPVIEITNIEETIKPDDAFVYPPDDSYIPTSVIL